MRRPKFDAKVPSWFAPYLFDQICPIYMILNLWLQNNMESLHWGSGCRLWIVEFYYTKNKQVRLHAWYVKEETKDGLLFEISNTMGDKK